MLKKAIWVYLFLLIFEGALRKWVIPGLSTPLLLIREPIVIWLIWKGFSYGWLKNRYVILMSITTTISFFLTLLIGHQNFATALFGWRIYILHFPLIFVMQRILSRDDILNMGRIVLYISIPMTILILLQFYLPQSSFVNRGVGGDMEGAGFDALLGYYRPSGTFSFTGGYTFFQLLVGIFLFYYMINNSSINHDLRIKPWLIWVILACYMLSIPYSISRTHMFQSILMLIFTLVAGLYISPRGKYSLLYLFLGLAFVVILFSMTGIANQGLEVFSARLEKANVGEGGFKGTFGERYFGSFSRGLFNFDAPFWGYGLGLGTSIGAKLTGGKNGMFSFFNGEEEWVRVTSESGIILGWIIIALRLLLSISIFRKSYKRLRSNGDSLPWMLSLGVLLTLPQGQIGVPTNLGFCVLLSGFALTLCGKKEKRR